MARTIRRKDGYKCDWHMEPWDYHRDRYWRGKGIGAMKWDTRRSRRADEREMLHRLDGDAIRPDRFYKRLHWTYL